MAGGGYKNFTTGEVLTASDVQDYLMDQSVMVFGGTAARGSAISSPAEGMVTYLSDSDTVEVYNGSAWSAVGGVGAANVSNTPTGTYSSGGTAYAYSEFPASGTLTVTEAGFADVLVVGGGGGGAVGSGASNFAAGGGGAGGHLYELDVYLPAGSLTVTVGAGGADGKQSPSPGYPGQPSRIGNTLVAVGGGPGEYQPGIDVNGYGGSGGGGSYLNAGGTGLTGQGNDGGGGSSSGGGGGGGAGTVGSAGGTNVGGNGGNGLATALNNVSTTRAGGGGGGGGTSGGTGGTGGGGNGGGTSGTTAGAANTGGGGGGSRATVQGGIGGSGIVIIRVRT